MPPLLPPALFREPAHVAGPEYAHDAARHPPSPSRKGDATATAAGPKSTAVAASRSTHDSYPTRSREIAALNRPVGQVRKALLRRTSGPSRRTPFGSCPRACSSCRVSAVRQDVTALRVGDVTEPGRYLPACRSGAAGTSLSSHPRNWAIPGERAMDSYRPAAASRVPV